MHAASRLLYWGLQNSNPVRRHVLRSTRAQARWNARPASTLQAVASAATQSPAPSTATTDPQPDVLIVGSGAAAMTAALRAHSRGLVPLVVEKMPRLGGTSTYSGGGLWMPNSHVASPGYVDSAEQVLAYLDALIGEAGPASSRERRVAFVENAPRTVEFLDELGFEFVASEGYPDYYPNLPGGKAGGRSIESKVFDRNVLGKWKDMLNYNPSIPLVPMYTYEVTIMMRSPRSLATVKKAIEVFGLRMGLQMLMGRSPITMGAALTGRLLHLNLQRGTSFWTDAPLKELIVSNGKVTGAVVERDGKALEIRAPRGVLLATGGFAKNAEMREKHHPHPTGAQWTSAPPGDKGDGINAATAVGAATALMDDAWWGPTLVDPADGRVIWCHFERALPHSFIVDAAGSRFTNEAQSYTTFVHDQYDRHKTNPAVPAFLIMDARHRKQYMMALDIMPGKMPKKHIDSGFIAMAPTLDALAAKLGIDAAGLARTAERFNAMVKRGVDEDYGRGGSAYDRFFGDPKYQKNGGSGVLGTVEQGPFYAAKIWPGDLGTKGGILTDEHARALRDDASVIEGLYATGNCSASVMGRQYAGSGSTLGPAMTFAYVAVNHMAGE